MSATGPAADARLALRLFALDPRRLGAIVLRGSGPLRDRLLEDLHQWLAPTVPLLRLPVHCDDETLFGGVDLTASLAAGRSVRRRGLLERAHGGVLVVPIAERIEPSLAGRLAQLLDDPAAHCGLVLLDDGAREDEGPPASLLDRAAFLVDAAHGDDGTAQLPSCESCEPSHIMLSDEAAGALARVASALGVEGVRPLLQAAAAACAHAALDARMEVAEEDLAAAVRLVLAPRATRLPIPPDTGQQPPPGPTPGDTQTNEAGSTAAGEDVLLEAALAALPADLLARLAAGVSPRRTKGSGGGKRARSGLRGRPLAARAGMPGGGARLALIDTLRAAVPWQALRRRESAMSDDRLLHLRRSDLRVRRFADRARAVTIVCVDASGSAAMARLAEAKGAVERLLAQAYVTRSEVALIAFRGASAELLLSPTRSLTRARRALAELPGGGGTPLAAALAMTRRLADSVAGRGATPLLVFLTDGSANIAADGTPGRARATEDALAAARALATSGHGALVIDIAPRPRPEAEAIACAMHARHLPLPLADSAAIARAVSASRNAA